MMNQQECYSGQTLRFFPFKDGKGYLQAAYPAGSVSESYCLFC